MARIYSRKHGQSGSKKPVDQSVPAWVSYKAAEVERVIVKLAKEGQSSSEIGLHLRDAYGIPSVKALTGKKIVQIMKDKGVQTELPEDLLNVIRRSLTLAKHLEENHKDYTAKRGLQITESQIKRLVDYYKAEKVLPKDFKYDRESLKMHVQ